jgi:hypothetical protein
MKANPRKTGDGDSGKRGKEKNRGTQDEFAIMGLILDENPILKQRVLEKIRIARALSAGHNGKVENTAEKKPDNKASKVRAG